MKIAFLFPGQGAQYAGMGKEFFECYPAAQATYRQANDVLGYDIAALCFNGPAEKLKETRYSQPAILITSIACFRVLQTEIPGLKSEAVAGLSLGEYTALVACGALEYTAALPLVQARANFMQEASEQNPGGMICVIGLEEKAVRDILARQGGEADIANVNCPGQIVLSGKTEQLTQLIPVFNQAGAKRVIPLEVNGPFHSRLMAPAQEKLTPYLEKAALTEPRTNFIANVTGTNLSDPEEIKRSLITQVASTTYWSKGIEQMLAIGIDTFIEIGPGKVLGGLLRKINKQARYFNVQDTASLNRTRDSL